MPHGHECHQGNDMTREDMHELLADQLGEFLVRQADLDTERAQQIADSCAEIAVALVALPRRAPHPVPRPDMDDYANVAYYCDLA